MLPGVRIEDIEAAVDAIERRNFTRTSEHLHRSQGAISKSIKRVEDGMPAKLFDRDTHPVRPTRSGMIFRYHARRALDSLIRGTNAAQRAEEPNRAVIEVGFTSYLDLDVIAYLEYRGRSAESGFSHKEHSSSTSEVISSVLSGKWDCGFIISPAAADGLVGVPLYRDPFGLALSSDHPLARRRKVKLEDLRNLPLVLPAKERNTGFRSWFMERCATAGVRPRIAQEVGNPNEAWFMASHLSSAALMPRASTRNLAKGATVFRPFAEEDLYADVQLVFRDEPQSPMLTAFVDTVLRMRDRMQHRGLDNGHEAAGMQAVPRPMVRPWKRAQPVRNDRLADLA